VTGVQSKATETEPSLVHSSSDPRPLYSPSSETLATPCRLVTLRRNAQVSDRFHPTSHLFSLHSVRLFLYANYWGIRKVTDCDYEPVNSLSQCDAMAQAGTALKVSSTDISQHCCKLCCLVWWATPVLCTRQDDLCRCLLSAGTLPHTECTRSIAVNFNLLFLLSRSKGRISIQKISLLVNHLKPSGYCMYSCITIFVFTR
jgi:hypothetical protein